MKRAFIIVLILLAFVGAGYYWRYHVHKTDGIASKPLNQPNAVSAVRVQQADIPMQIQAVGTLLANQSVFISPEVAGHISEILFREGSFVTRGTPLIKLDATTQKAKLQSSQADLVLSEIQYKRTEALVKKKMVAQKELDSAKANLQKKQSQVDQDRATLEKMTMRAPFNGYLSKRKISVGDYVTVGQKLLKLVDKDNLRLAYQVPERYQPQLKIGQKVEIRAPALPNQSFVGKVFFISPDIDITSHAVEVQALIPNKQHKLSPGMFIQVKQILGISKNALVIPEQSLIPSVEGQAVYKIVNGKAVGTPIVIGAFFAGRVQVLKGLSANDLIITAGQQKIKDGSPVKVVNN